MIHLTLHTSWTNNDEFETYSKETFGYIIHKKHLQNYRRIIWPQTSKEGYSSINSQAWRKAKDLRRPLRMFWETSLRFIITGIYNQNQHILKYKTDTQDNELTWSILEKQIVTTNPYFNQQRLPMILNFIQRVKTNIVELNIVKVHFMLK